MTALVAWVVFPIVATLVALGLGLLADWATGERLPGPLVLPVGFALLVCLTQLTTWKSALAPATPAIVAVAGAAGLALRARPRSWRRPDRWAAAAAIGVFAVYLAPIALSGHPGFAGYVLLGDTSIHLELADRLVHHGATVAGLQPSGYTTSLQAYFATSYPTGSHTAFGALGALVGIDLAWLYQPFLAWMSALGALSLYVLARTVTADRRMAAAIAFVAAQPGLVYAFALQGSIKEIATITSLTTVFALLPWFLARARSWRAPIPLAVAAAGAVGAIDVAAGAWLAPALLGALVALVWRVGLARRGLIAAQAAAFAAVGAVLTLPTLTGISTFARTTQKVLTGGSQELGDLPGPLDRLHVFGIWPTGDFRLPLAGVAEHVALYVAIAAVALGLVALARRRAAAVLAYAAVSCAGWLYVTKDGSPWADAKALVILSPAVLLVALAAGAGPWPGRLRWTGPLLVAVLGGGVLWTNALAYHDAQISNWPRLHELETLGSKYSGNGPTFTPEFEEFAKYFLRGMAPVAAAEPYKPAPSATIPGRPLRFGFSAELGTFTASYLNTFRTLIVRRSPVQSRPPASFRMIERGRFYTVWRRDDAVAARIVGELPLGTRFQRGAPVPCGRLRALAAQAGAQGAHLVYATAPRLVVGQPEWGARSPHWQHDGADPVTLRADGPGYVEMILHVARAGRYQAWVEGSLSRPLELKLGGKPFGRAPSGLSPRGEGEAVLAGEVDLPRGTPRLRLVRGGGALSPGNGGAATILGPITFVPDGQEIGTLRTLQAAGWRSLCGRMADWVEAVR